MKVRKYNIFLRVLVVFILIFLSSVFIFLTQTVGAANIPSLTTQPASGVTSTGATLNGNITSVGSTTPIIRGFNYGTTVNYGATTTEETGGFGTTGYSTGSYVKLISDLTCGTTYHYRSYAVNSIGPGYGNDTTFTTSVCGSQPPTSQPPTTTTSSSSTSGQEPNAQFTSTTKTSFGTMAFGGKVRSTTVPMVKCTGSGTIFILSSNLTGTTSALIESQSSDSGIKKAATAIKALSDSIPFFSTDSQKNPKVGDQILGKAKIVPDYSTCKMRIGPYEIPFPVRKTTDNYSVSGKSSSSSSDSSSSGSWTGSTYNYE